MSDDGTEKEYRYYPIERIAYLFTEPADSLTDDYRDYVYQHYLNYPTKGTERMQTVCGGQSRGGYRGNLQYRADVSR